MEIKSSWWTASHYQTSPILRRYRFSNRHPEGLKWLLYHGQGQWFDHSTSCHIGVCVQFILLCYHQQKQAIFFQFHSTVCWLFDNCISPIWTEVITSCYLIGVIQELKKNWGPHKLWGPDSYIRYWIETTCSIFKDHLGPWFEHFVGPHQILKTIGLRAHHILIPDVIPMWKHQRSRTASENLGC